MAQLSDHTCLINMILGLVIGVQDWPSSFKDLGYTLDYIEPKIAETNPDVIITNNKKNHALLVDCKSKTIKEKQLEKYCCISNNPKPLAKNSLVKVSNPNHLTADALIISYSDLSKVKIVIKNKIPCLFVEENDGFPKEIHHGNVEFKDKELNSLFPIDLSKQKIPLFLYPFSKDDRGIFVIKLLREIESFAHKDKSFTAEDLLREMHPYWKYIHVKEQKELTKMAVTKINYLQNNQLKDIIKRVGKKWRIDISKDPRSFQSFHTKISELSHEYDDIQDVLFENG